MNTPDRFLRVKETALALGVDERTLRNHIRSGEVPHTRFGRAVLIPESWLAWKLRESQFSTMARTAA